MTGLKLKKGITESGWIVAMNLYHQLEIERAYLAELCSWHALVEQEMVVRMLVNAQSAKVAEIEKQLAYYLEI